MNDIKQITHFLKQSDQFLVVSHLDPDGDAICSTLATGYLLRYFGKKVTMVNQSPIPKRFHFLAGTEGILLPEQVTDRFQYVFALDCADQERIGSCQTLFATQVQIINIDHHITNENYGTVNVVFPEAAATVQILFDWIEDTAFHWDIPLASIIYTGLLTDTGGFRYANTSSQVLKQAAKLIELGIDAYQITDMVLETTTIEQLKLLKTALNTLERSKNQRVAWMSLTLEDIQGNQATNNDLEGIVNYARNIEGVDVGILFRETEEGIKVSFRSRAELDVGAFAKRLGGGGHVRAAGCKMKGSLEEVKNFILDQLNDQ